MDNQDLVRAVRASANGAATIAKAISDLNIQLYTAEDIGSILYPRTAAEVTAGVTPSDYSYPAGTPERYGAVGDGTTDDSLAIRTGLSVLQNYGVFKFSEGKRYRWECTQANPYTGTGSMNGYAFNNKTGIVIDARGATFVQTTVNNSTFGLFNFYDCTSCEVWGGHSEGSYTPDSAWTGGLVAFQGGCRACKLIEGSVQGGYALAVILDKTSTASGVSGNKPSDCFVSGYADNTRRACMFLGVGAGHRVEVRGRNVSRFYIEGCDGISGHYTLRNTDSAYTTEKLLISGSNAQPTKNIELTVDMEVANASPIRFQVQDTSAVNFQNIVIRGRIYGQFPSAGVSLGAGSGSTSVTYEHIDISDLYVEQIMGVGSSVYVIPSHAITMTDITLPRTVKSAGNANMVHIDNSAAATINGVVVPDGFRYTSGAGISALYSTGGTVSNFQIGNGVVAASASYSTVFSVTNADGLWCGRVKFENSKYAEFTGSKNVSPGIVLAQGGNSFMYSGGLSDATNYMGYETMLITSGSATINSLKYIIPGQKITFIFNGGTQTFVNGTNIKLSGAANFTATSLDTLTLVCIDPPSGGPLSTSTMYEVSRSVN